MTFDPMKRITAANALQHPYFKASPRPQTEAMMPTYPSSHVPAGGNTGHSSPSKPPKKASKSSAGIFASVGGLSQEKKSSIFGAALR